MIFLIWTINKVRNYYNTFIFYCSIQWNVQPIILIWIFTNRYFQVLYFNHSALKVFTCLSNYLGGGGGVSLIPNSYWRSLVEYPGFRLVRFGQINWRIFQIFVPATEFILFISIQGHSGHNRSIRCRMLE